jgi:thioredoxin 1
LKRVSNKGANVAGSINDVTDGNFQAEVIEHEKAVLVDFWAPWCGPCRVIAPSLEEIAEEREDLRIVKLNVDDNQETAARYGVLGMPTFMLFRDGAPVLTLVGSRPRKRLEAELAAVL